MDKELYKVIAESKKNGLRTFVFTSLGDKDYGSKAVIREGELVWISKDTSFFKENLEQIKEKKYDTELINRGVTEITYIGLAFYKKKLKMKYENRIIIV